MSRRAERPTAAGVAILALVASVTGFTAQEMPEIFAAVYDGDVAAVRAQLDAGVDPDLTFDDRTPLMFAVWREQMEIVELLVDRGADLHAETAAGVPLINIAAEGGSLPILTYLLERGADVDARGGTMHARMMKWKDHDQTPLIWAVRLKQPDAVDFLLEHGADPDLRDDTGRTALIWAAGVGSPEAARSLIQAGADLSLRDDRGESALDLARGMAERFPDDAARYEAVADALSGDPESGDGSWRREEAGMSRSLRDGREGPS